MQAARRWERIAPADSVFDLCRIAPHGSGRILADFPDLLLHHRPDPDTEAQLGPVLICARGVGVGGRMLADPDADLRFVKSGAVGETIREWLRFRAWALLPLLDNYLAPGSPVIAKRVLAPFRPLCSKCGVARVSPRTT